MMPDQEYSVIECLCQLSVLVKKPVAIFILKC